MGTAAQARVLLHLPALHCYPGTANSNTVSGKDCFETRTKTSQLLLIALQEVEIKCNQDCNCQCETTSALQTNRECTSNTRNNKGKQRERIILLLCDAKPRTVQWEGHSSSEKIQQLVRRRGTETSISTQE